MNEQEKQATITALRLLTATPKSKARLKQKLKEKGYPSQVIEGTVSRLEQDGLLNDKSFAASIFQTFSQYRPSGRKRIAFEMKKRGLGEKVIDEMLQKFDPEAERQAALQLAETKSNRWQKLEPMKRRKKIYDFLLRRGFDFTLAREIVDGIDKRP